MMIEYDESSILNQVLEHLLVATNQHAIHARMLKFFGEVELADIYYKQYIDEMKYTDLIVEYSLKNSLTLSSVQLRELRIGRTVEEVVKLNQLCAQDFLEAVNRSIKAIKCKKDEGIGPVLLAIQESIQEHTQFTSAYFSEEFSIV